MGRRKNQLNKPFVVAVIQARTKSTRLPGKVLKKLADKTMVEHVVDRVAKAKLVDEVVVATSTDKADDKLVRLLKKAKMNVFRGSGSDVLDRFYKFANKNNANYVVRICADCPAIDFEVIDKAVEKAINTKADLVTNTMQPSYPDGLDVWVIKFEALKTAWKKARLQSEREHVTPYIHDRPDEFKVVHLVNDEDLSDKRWTVDKESDYELMKKIFKSVYAKNHDFVMKDVLNFLGDNPELEEINKDTLRDEGYLKSLRGENGLKTLRKLKIGKSQRLYTRAKRIIPGGTQLLSKRPEMYLPNLWPAYYGKAKGCEVWDLDGNKYIDMSYMAVGPCTLGYADDDVDSAVIERIKNASMTTLNCPEEVELAEKLVELHPWAEMVRYARTGGEAMAMAVRIARAKSKKDVVMFCGYHGWSDWYLAANLGEDKLADGHLLPGLEPLGVPRGLKGTMKPFHFNDTEEFLKQAIKTRNELGVIVMEPMRSHYPNEGFLETIREVADDLGVVLVFDEISAGWRVNVGGSHLQLGVNPDIAVLGKAMSNGYPMAAVIGKSKVMDVVQESFISSTYWTDGVGPAAALATIGKMEKINLPNHLMKMGRRVQEGWSKLAGRHGLKIDVSGIEPLGHFEFKDENKLELKTLFTQEMLRRGFLATNAFYASWAHKRGHVDLYLAAVDEVFEIMAGAIEENRVDKLLEGPVCHSGFARLT